MKSDVQKITDLIINTDTDHRGDLLFNVSKLLKDHTQYHTANIIKSAALEYGVSGAVVEAGGEKSHCMCDACKGGAIHDSDCSVHNMPAYPNKPCDCAISAQG